MKNFNLFALVASITLVFSSCSTNETILPEEQSLDLLKTYTIKRDANGAYSVDFDLNGNAASENVIDNDTNIFHFYPSDNQMNKRVSQDLTIDGTQLKVSFVDTNSDNSSQITIIDDNLKTFSKSSDNEKLKDYSISSNEDGTFNLDFSVKNKVKVDFVYNEDIDTYEIHLEDGKSNETNFSRVLEKEDGKLLKFDFVNHINSNTSAKGIAQKIEVVRKPKGVIGEEEEM